MLLGVSLYICDFFLSFCLFCDRECKVFTVDGLSNDLHAFDLVNHKLPSRDGSTYRNLVASISSTIAQARHEGEDILESYAKSLEEALHLHESTTNFLLEKSAEGQGQGQQLQVSDLLAHSNEYLTFSGHVVVAWMWLKQGIIANSMLSPSSSRKRSLEMNEIERNFYLGKIAALDYFSNVELPRTKYMAEIVRTNPQVGNMHDIKWHS